MEGLVGRERGEARIGDGLARAEGLCIEQLTVHVEVIGDGDVLLRRIVDVILMTLQSINGEGGRLERDRAIIDGHAHMDAF